jgi:formamidopyrimidine-DNA glycosylase
MPELAEVEFYRKLLNAGMRQIVKRVHLHAGKRATRGIDEKEFVRALTKAKLLESWAHAKQMLFRFSGDVWIGIHLGMTGRLSVESSDFTPGRHDHLVLYQTKQALVYHDPRMFGRVRFHQGAMPDWWTSLPPAIDSKEFTKNVIRDFFRRRARLAVKAALLIQERFPGVGNWMADEILWRARILPKRLCGKMTAAEVRTVWKETRAVCAEALATVGVDFSDPPKGWLFHVRWSGKGKCPRCSTGLKTAQIGGRTTRWCPRCQR